MKAAVSVFFFLFSFMAFAQTDLTLSTAIYHNEEEIFYSRTGHGPFDNALAMNITYAPIKNLRTQLERAIGKELKFFQGWNENGEAHITVVTPVEYDQVLKSKLTMKEIDAIAERYDIQSAKLNVLGIGSGKLSIDGNEEETYFVIVDSADLRLIRQMIFYEFTRRGGNRSAFDPSWFFPHITIGYTKRDLYEADGMIKNLKFSLDKRFNLKFSYPKMDL